MPAKLDEECYFFDEEEMVLRRLSDGVAVAKISLSPEELEELREMCPTFPTH